jgi:hypothetical protein
MSLKKACQDCISAVGEYFEGDKDHSVAGMSKKIAKSSSNLFEQTTGKNV